MSKNQQKWFVVETPNGTIVPGTLGRTKKITRQWIRFAGEKVIEVELRKTNKRKEPSK